MSKDITMEDIVPKVDPTSEPTKEVTEPATEVVTEPVVQDPLKVELDKVTRKESRTEKEKAEFSLKKTAERLKELGGDPNSILNIGKEEEEEILENDDDIEDDTPLTLGLLKKMQMKDASKTAFQQAEEIANETERELTKYHLKNTIRSTGNPADDLKLARALVNSVKNAQISEEISRKSSPASHSNSSGVDAKKEKKIVYTEHESQLMRAPFNLSHEDIVSAREGKQRKF